MVCKQVDSGRNQSQLTSTISVPVPIETLLTTLQENYLERILSKGDHSAAIKVHTFAKVFYLIAMNRRIPLGRK